MADETAKVVRTVDAPLAPPSANSGLLEVFRRRYLLGLLVRREISARYQGSFLGLFWSYVNPAFRLAMYYFVIQVIVPRPIENFAIHLFAGMVVVHFFTESFGAGTRSIVRNKSLIRKMAVPREMFPAASILVSAYHVIPGLLMLIATCAALGWRPDLVGLGAALLGFAIVGVLGTALALLFSAANVFFRDLGNLVQLLTQFTTFSVPMIYPFSMVEDRFGGHTELYLANPLAEAVLLFQRAFWVGTTDAPDATMVDHLPDHLYTRGAIHLAVAVVLLGVAQLTFSRLENKIPERL